MPGDRVSRLVHRSHRTGVDLKTEPPRTGMPSPQLSRAEFDRRFRNRFADPAFEPFDEALSGLGEVAWQAYEQGRKSPRTRKAGPSYANPDYELSVDWIEARAAIDAARLRHDDPDLPPRILLINGSSRSEHTCPGEMSKSWRLLQVASEAIAAERPETALDVLDLSRLASEYGRNIHPCKACFSTAAPLCHFPCSCYPHHSLGQVDDWMNDIYPLWVGAHGILIVTPVNWYQATSPLKLMIDRLVCADGGNPDPTRTDGKDVALAKELELQGWPYPRHLAGRSFAVVVHGDTEGPQNLRRMLTDWLESMSLRSAGHLAELDRYVGYYEPYASSHEALDRDQALQAEVGNAAVALVRAVVERRGESEPAREAGLEDPRPK